MLAFGHLALNLEPPGGPWVLQPPPSTAGRRRRQKPLGIIRDELTFTSFGHGGFTEAADSDLTDAEIRAQGRHKSAKVLPRYAKRTMKQVAAGAKKRREQRDTQS
jgi:hypothetical protein